MTYCKECDKDTETEIGKFKDVVYSKDGEYIDVHVASCTECGAHKSMESDVG